MKTTRRILSMVLALMMILSLSVTAFAAEIPIVKTAPTGTVTVMFTEGLSENGDSGNVWLGVDPDDHVLYTGGTVNLSSLVGAVKKYIPEGVSDPMDKAASVMDVIMAANSSNTFSTGWDAEPWDGDPGAYINNVNNTELDYNYTETTDANNPNLIHCNSHGTGFVVIIKDANGKISFPTSYVSNIAPADGMTIYVDLAAYDYNWTKTAE